MYSSGNRGFAAAVITGGQIGVSGTAAALRPVPPLPSMSSPESSRGAASASTVSGPTVDSSAEPSGADAASSDPSSDSSGPESSGGGDARRQAPWDQGRGPAGQHPGQQQRGQGAPRPPWQPPGRPRARQPQQPPSGARRTPFGPANQRQGARTPPFGRFEEPPSSGGLASARALLDPEQSMPGVARHDVGEATAAEGGAPRWEGRPGGGTGGLRVVPSPDSASQHAVRTDGSAGTVGHRSVAEMTSDAGLRPVADAAGGRRRRRTEDTPAVSPLRVVRDTPPTSENGPGDGHTDRQSGQAGGGGYRTSPEEVGSEGYRPLTEPHGAGGVRPAARSAHAGSGADAESSQPAASSVSSSGAGGRRASGTEEATVSARPHGSARTEHTEQSRSNGASVGRVGSVDSPSLGLERSTIGALGPAEGSLGTGFHAYGEAAPEVELGSLRWRESHSAPNGLFRDRAIESSLPCAAVVSQQFTAPRLGFPPAPPVRFRGTCQPPSGPANGAPSAAPVNAAAPGDAPRNGGTHGIESSSPSSSGGHTSLFEHDPMADSVSTTALAPVGGFGLDHPGPARPPAGEPYDTGYRAVPQWESEREPSQQEFLPRDTSAHDSSGSGMPRHESSPDGLSHQPAHRKSAYSGTSYGSAASELYGTADSGSSQDSPLTGSSYSGESSGVGYQPSYGGSPGTGAQYRAPLEPRSLDAAPLGTGSQYRASLEPESRHADPLGADGYGAPLSGDADYIGSLPSGSLSSSSFSSPEADDTRDDSGAGSPRYSSHFEERTAALGSLDSSGLFKSLSPRER